MVLYQNASHVMSPRQSAYTFAYCAISAVMSGMNLFLYWSMSAYLPAVFGVLLAR